MHEDQAPDTQPSGALVPPPRIPPTSVATAAPVPPRPLGPRSRTRSPFQAAIATILDGLDLLGDRIAQVLR
jgi:hypothetical protein